MCKYRNVQVMLQYAVISKYIQACNQSETFKSALLLRYTAIPKHDVIKYVVMPSKLFWHYAPKPRLAAMAQYALPMGLYALPVGQHALPQGQYALPMGQYALPMGLYSLSMAQYALPVGQYALSMAQYALSMAQYTLSMGLYALPMGQYALRMRQYYLPMGQHALPQGQYALPMGQYALPNRWVIFDESKYAVVVCDDLRSQWMLGDPSVKILAELDNQFPFNRIIQRPIETHGPTTIMKW